MTTVVPNAPLASRNRAVVRSKTSGCKAGSSQNGAARVAIQLALLSGFLAGRHSLAAANAPLQETPAPAPWSVELQTPQQENGFIVRLYYQDRLRLGQIVSQYDVFEYANHEEGYVLARLWPSEYKDLLQAGYRLEIDEAQTALANRPLTYSAAQTSGIPGFPSYRTVEETYASLSAIASNYPALARLADIGDSWEKVTPGGLAGYDLQVLVLSNKLRPGPKPRFFLMAEHHARELTTAEMATRFAEELVARYGTDPDITFILDYFEVHVLPLANPDGRKWAEQGRLWRKNTDNDDGCTTFPNYGTDLNRNCDFKWGTAGTSTNQCNDVYPGPAPASEPENQAIQGYVRSLFPDQRGPNDTDPAPTDTTGLIISLHSYSQLVLFPWGWTANPAPNRSGLETLGRKFGFFNRYLVEPSNQLYPTSGSVDDWAYGELGVPAYTFELGTTFFENSANFENVIYPSNRLALLYACKACRQPYLNPAGPDVLPAATTPTTNLAGTVVSVVAIASDGRYSSGTTNQEPVEIIAAARYSVNDPSWVTDVVTWPMTTADGTFNSSNEVLRAMIDTTGWSPGRHTIFLEAQDANGNWGVPSAVFVWIAPLRITGTVGSDGFVLRWPSVRNKFYTILQADDPAASFSVLDTQIPAQPPLNSYTNEVRTGTSRFYKIQMEEAFDKFGSAR